MAVNKMEAQLRALVPRHNLVMVEESYTSKGHFRMRLRAGNGQEHVFVFVINSGDPRAIKNSEAALKRFSRRNVRTVITSKPVCSPAPTMPPAMSSAIAAVQLEPPEVLTPPAVAAPVEPVAPLPAVAPAAESLAEPSLAAVRAIRRVGMEDFVVIRDWVAALRPEERITTVEQLTKEVSELVGKPVSESTTVRALASAKVTLTAPPEEPKAPTKKAPSRDEQIRILTRTVHHLLQATGASVPEEFAELLATLQS